MEKVKFNNGMTFPLIVNGVNDFMKDQLILNFTPELRNLDEIERIVEAKENTQRIEILDDKDALLRPFNGYVIYDSITLNKGQFIGYETVPATDGDTAAGDNSDMPKEVYSDVVTVTLRRNDLRDEIRKIQEGQELQDGAIAELAEVVSTIAEGGEL